MLIKLPCYQQKSIKDFFISYLQETHKITMTIKYFEQNCLKAAKINKFGLFNALTCSMEGFDEKSLIETLEKLKIPKKSKSDNLVTKFCYKNSGNLVKRNESQKFYKTVQNNIKNKENIKPQSTKNVNNYKARHIRKLSQNSINSVKIQKNVKKFM